MKKRKPEPMETSATKLNCNSCQSTHSIIRCTNGRLQYNKLIFWFCKECGCVFLTGNDFTQVEPGIIGPDPCFTISDLNKLTKLICL